MSTLEHRLRRWLQLFPAEQREELLGVVLASTTPGKRRPGPRQIADLVAGAAHIQLRRKIRAVAGPVWRDAFSMLSLVTTLVLFTGMLEIFSGLQGQHAVLTTTSGFSGPLLALWPFVAVFSLMGRHRTAAGFAWVAALSQVPWLLFFQFQEGNGLVGFFGLGSYFPWLGLALIAAASLSLSDGLRRGIVLLGRRRVLLPVTVAVLAYALIGFPPLDDRVVVPDMNLQSSSYGQALVLIAAPLMLILTVCTDLRSAPGRRCTALLALSLSPLFCAILAVLAAQVIPQFPAIVAAPGIEIAFLVAGYTGPVLTLAIIALAASSRLRGRRRRTS